MEERHDATAVSHFPKTRLVLQFSDQNHRIPPFGVAPRSLTRCETGSTFSSPLRLTSVCKCQNILHHDVEKRFPSFAFPTVLSLKLQQEVTSFRPGTTKLITLAMCENPLLCVSSDPHQGALTPVLTATSARSCSCVANPAYSFTLSL